MHGFPSILGKQARKIPRLYTESCKRLWFWGKTSDFRSDFAADTGDFRSDFCTEANDYASDFCDFPGDFSGDFGGEPRTAKQPPEATETAPPEQAAPPTKQQVNENGGKLAAQAVSHGAWDNATP